MDNSTNPGSVAGGENLFGSDSVPASSGSVMWLEFEIVASPAPGTNITSLITPVLSGIKCCKLICTDGLEMTGLSAGDATFTYIWSAPAKPHMEVWNETSIIFPNNVHNVGTTFWEDIYIASLNGAWWLTNASVQWSYNSALLTVAYVQFNAIVWDLYTNFVNGSGILTVTAASTTAKSGDVYLARVQFRIISEQTTTTFGTYRSSPRVLSNIQLASSIYPGVNPILFDPQTNKGGVAPPIYPVIVYDFLLAMPPFLMVSSATLGPEPVVGQLFNVTVTLCNVTASVHHLMAIQYRLQYNSTLVQPVAVYEGDYFKIWAAAEAAAGYPPSSYPPGTWITSVVNDPDGIWGPHVAVGQMLFPNATGRWNEPMPDGNGTITIITFRLLYQSYGEPNIVMPLTIAAGKGVGLNNMVAQSIVPIGLMPPINGAVTITTNLPGRAIDLYGGAVNSGMIQLDTQTIPQFVPPYGGQGPNMPMDMVEPQSWVYLNVNVTYNYWPVQHKNVAFEIVENDGQTVYNKLSAFTDTNGVASIGFRMPWPCDNPESLFGVWHVTATVQLADVVINDTMDFHYDYIVHVWKVTTDKFQYNHGEGVSVTFEYGSHAQQTYNAIFVVSIVDELGVTVGLFVYEAQVGGTVYCQYKNWTGTVRMTLPKWAYAGIATVHVNVFDKEPVQGGVAITPEYVGPTIAIQPY